jgi:HTH-type transcriptional regulator / antitoxin MqsA
MSKIDTLCPLCGGGTLQPQVRKNLVEYRGQTSELDVHSAICNTCGSETSSARQLRKNKRIMEEFKKRVNGG